MMRHVVVRFDMVEIDRLGDTGNLVEILQVAGQVRIVDDAPEVALEMAMVDGIEPKQRDEQSPIRFDEL